MTRAVISCFIWSFILTKSSTVIKARTFWQTERRIGLGGQCVRRYLPYFFVLGLTLPIVCCVSYAAQSYPAASVRLSQKPSTLLADSTGRRRWPETLRRRMSWNTVHFELAGIVLFALSFSRPRSDGCLQSFCFQFSRSAPARIAFSSVSPAHVFTLYKSRSSQWSSSSLPFECVLSPDLALDPAYKNDDYDYEYVQNMTTAVFWQLPGDIALISLFPVPTMLFSSQSIRSS